MYFIKLIFIDKRALHCARKIVSAEIFSPIGLMTSYSSSPNSILLFFNFTVLDFSMSFRVKYKVNNLPVLNTELINRLTTFSMGLLYHNLSFQLKNFFFFCGGYCL